MSNWLTITWESTRLRLLVARLQGGTATFEYAEQFSLQKNENELPLKEQLIQFVQKNRLIKADTIVLLNRSDVEVRPMVFPPVPVDELCDLVRFQAIKEFNVYDQNSPLDFFVTNKFENISRSALFPAVFKSSGNDNSTNRNSTSGGESKPNVSNNTPIHLLASTIRRELFQKINKFCEDAGLNLRRILLRPCESAYLLKFSSNFNPVRTILLLELDTDETAQTVLYQGDPVFIRSPKISPPSDVTNPDFIAVLAAELRRTMIAVRNEIQGVTVDDIIICGGDSHFTELSRLLSETLNMPVKTFNPWVDHKLLSSKSRFTKNGTMRITDKLNNNLTSGNVLNPERYTALIGSILRAGKNVQSDIDFCNPKRRPERIGYRVFANIAVVAIFLLLAGWIGYEFNVQYSLSKETKKLSNQKTELERTAKSIAPARSQLQAIENWYVDKIDWFEQLGWLSRNAPEPRDMMLTTLTLSATGGSMNFTSLVRDSSIVSPMEEKFRSNNHDVKTGEKSETRTNSQYRYQVTLWVYLTKSDWNLTPIEDEPIIEPIKEDKNKKSTPTPTPNTTPTNTLPTPLTTGISIQPVPVSLTPYSSNVQPSAAALPNVQPNLPTISESDPAANPSTISNQQYDNMPPTNIENGDDYNPDEEFHDENIDEDE
ncbi:MAG: hypothetical protein LBE18_10710 [Planctomycetaceae bacterium]|jgi:hypothetical protein|nr:hypothetical protein [Planctomycetaceae bacterium]